MGQKLSFTAVGDYILQKRLPIGYHGFQEISNFIKRGDARYFNFESSVPNEQCFGNQFNGGSFLMSSPAALDDARAFGFNVLSSANNHAMDFSYNGLLNTLDTIRAKGFPCSGTGRNLDEAAAPGYLDTVNGRFGIIGCVSTMVNDAALAGRQSRRFLGRPGVNGIRVDEKVAVTKEQFAVLQEICNSCDVNNYEDIMREEGWDPPLPENILAIKNVRFELGKTPKYITRPNPEDMARIERAIYDAQEMCSCILVSIHTHEMTGHSKEKPADFFVEFAHRCIDAGAHAVIGHGPHLLRPIEIYKQRPIFYSLGDFLFQEELSECAPEDAYAAQGLTSDSTMRELYYRRTANHTRGLLSDPRFLESVIPYCEFEDGALTKVELMPIEMGFGLPHDQIGLPRPAYNKGILERLQTLSMPYGTEIQIFNGIGSIKL